MIVSLINCHQVGRDRRVGQLACSHLATGILERDRTQLLPGRFTELEVMKLDLCDCQSGA